MTRSIFKIIGYAVVIVLAYLLLAKIGWLPSPASWFRPAPVSIDETPLLVNRIRALSELSSLSVQDEVVVTQIKPAGTAKQIISLVTPGAAPALDHLVLVVKGELELGTDLKGLTEQQVFIAGDSIAIHLPAAKVLLAQINPSQTETFIEEGDWTPDEITKLKIKARDQLIERAKQKGLLQKANERSLKIMEDFLRTLGFNKTSVSSQ
ncbi:MAG: DUF4230 domain-containing protein [Bacteroidetes bacterium]|nr:DUF4230 domain-containing protein [Bacteroidota bacterium]